MKLKVFSLSTFLENKSKRTHTIKQPRISFKIWRWWQNYIKMHTRYNKPQYYLNNEGEDQRSRYWLKQWQYNLKARKFPLAHMNPNGNFISWHATSVWGSYFAELVWDCVSYFRGNYGELWRRCFDESAATPAADRQPQYLWSVAQRALDWFCHSEEFWSAATGYNVCWEARVFWVTHSSRRRAGEVGIEAFLYLW